MPKIILEIDLEGQVHLEGEGFEGSACEKSKKLKQLEKTLQKDGEIDEIKLKYQEKQEEKEVLDIKIENLF